MIPSNKKIKRELIQIESRLILIAPHLTLMPDDTFDRHLDRELALDERERDLERREKRLKM